MPDITINPSALVTNGALVSESNPLPATSVATGPAGTDITINPRTWVVNGAIVSVSNPLPISLV